MKNLLCWLGIHKMVHIKTKKTSFLTFTKYFCCLRCGKIKVEDHKIDI